MLVGRWWWWWKSGARPLKVLELSAVAHLLPSISVACCHPVIFLLILSLPNLLTLCHLQVTILLGTWPVRASIVLVSCCPSFWFGALLVGCCPVTSQWVSQKWLESLVESMPIFDQVSRLQREKLLGSCCPAFVFEQSRHHTLLVAIPTTTKSGYIADMIFDKQLKRLAAKQVKHSTHATRRWRQYL